MSSGLAEVSISSTSYGLAVISQESIIKHTRNPLELEGLQNPFDFNLTLKS